MTACTHLCVSARISSSLARAAAAPKSPPPSAPSRASSAANGSSSPKKSEKPALWYALRRRSGAVYDVNERNMATVGTETLREMLQARDWTGLEGRSWEPHPTRAKLETKARQNF